MAKNEKFKKNINIQNRKASFEYSFIDTYTAGIVLQGTEIKSIRQAKVNMQDAFCLFIDGELFIRNLHISPYERGNIHNHDAKAERKLLLQKRELRKLETGMSEKGLTIIPKRIFINDRGLAKVEIALAKGKKLYDKRQSIKEKDQKRELQRMKY
ncbi:MAG: SsrA-binding protein SmpB [Bernardetiaceae bacterium]|nr:SsrA-binding protein SmpB [Bernardetiaceae bacterium]